MKLSPNFSTSEAACNCGEDDCDFSEYKVTNNPLNLSRARRLAENMERLRVFLGGKRISVISWFRCPEWNKKHGGASDSYHLRGEAMDFTHETLTPREIQALLSKKDNRSRVNGLGKYRTFTHCDWRGFRADWKG